MTPIRTKEEYETALGRVQELRVRSLPEETEELAQLLQLIEYYENKIMFLKSGTAFVNNIFLDWNVGVTSTDVQLSFRDNSATSGYFQNSGAGTVPVFAYTGTFGGLARNLQVTLLRTGRFQVALRIIDNSGNYSMYEMDWIVL